MLKTDVLKHFDPEQKALQATADALGITKSAVSQWGEVIPEGVAYKLQVMTAGILRVNPSLYQRHDQPRPAA